MTPERYTILVFILKCLDINKHWVHQNSYHSSYHEVLNKLIWEGIIDPTPKKRAPKVGNDKIEYIYSIKL